MTLKARQGTNDDDKIYRSGQEEESGTVIYDSVGRKMLERERPARVTSEERSSQKEALSERVVITEGVSLNTDATS